MPRALDTSGKRRPQSVAEKQRSQRCLHNHYPRGEGLATSPGRRARLRFHSPVLRLRGRRCASPNDRRPLADYYFVLGVPPDATETELHAAWRRQLKYWHPDRGNHPDALEHAKLINLAHDVLTNSTKRAAYDRQRAAAGWRPSTSAPSYSRPVQWKTVSREGPPRAPKGFDRHGFVARLEEMMNRGRLMIEKRKDLASASKWEAQSQALLRDELGDHAYEAFRRGTEPAPARKPCGGLRGVVGRV